MDFPRYARSAITWQIENLKAENLEVINFVDFESPIFTIKIKHPYGYRAAESKWRFSASRLRGSCLSLFLEPVKNYASNQHFNGHSNLLINYEMFIKDLYEKSKRYKGTITRLYDKKRLGKIINAAELSGPYNYRYKTNNAIHVVVYFEIIELLYTTYPTPFEKSFESMYGCVKYSDYTLVTADKEEIQVHKIVLSTRSTVFERMIESKLKEGEENKAVIDDIGSKSLKEFLRFLYCGHVNEIDSVAFDLIYAADKYDLKDLKPLCVKSMVETISVDTAVETLMIADLHQEKGLKIFTMDFILWNYDELKKHESWEKLTAPLCKEVLEYVIERLTNGNLYAMGLNIATKMVNPSALPNPQRNAAQQNQPAAALPNPQRNAAQQNQPAAALPNPQRNAAQPAIANNN